MNIAIIISAKDPASMNIGESLEKYKLPKNVTIHTVDTAPVYSEQVIDEIEADMYIFASKHSAKGLASLTLHSPGNWFSNDLGGNKNELSIAPALFLANGFLKLTEIKRREKLDIEVAQECTHHGPTFNKQVMFIEIGSSLENWKIKKYGDVIAEAIYYLVSTDFSSRTIAFGIGGTHYCSNFSKLIVRENYAFGHVCPKYQLDNLSWEMVEQALSKSLPKVQEVVIDWKGVSGHKDKIRVIMENLKNHSILVRRI